MDLPFFDMMFDSYQFFKLDWTGGVFTIIIIIIFPSLRIYICCLI